MVADRVRVKICGLRDASAARVAVAAGAGALGFIRAPARRQITPGEIQAILDKLRREHDDLPPAIAVFVDASPEEIAGDVEASGVDMVQLAGDEEPEVIERIPVPSTKALRFESGTSIDEASREVERWLDRPKPARWVLVEGFLPGSHGGTGTLADWTLAAALAKRYPVWLAGGLNPANVARAIGEVHPVGVDVSSGVERNGVKDAALIRAFVAEAQRASSLD